MTAIEKLINVAEGELGYLEKKSNSNLDDKTANAGYNNFTKYWRDLAPYYQGSYWCAIFIDWCFTKTFGAELAKKLLKHSPFINCETIAGLFTKHANPKVGDIVVFYTSGRGFLHTGLVVEVNGDMFKTIEGNTSGYSGIVDNGGCVCKKTHYNSTLPGTKFLRPDYSIVPEDKVEVKELTTINDIVWELGYRGIVSDKEGMINAMSVEPNGRLYWLGRKVVNYIRGKGI